MGNRVRQVVKAFAIAAVVAVLPLASAHAGNGWGHYRGGGSYLFFGLGGPSYYYPPPPAYYYPPPPVYYVPPPPIYYAPPPPAYYPPATFGLQFNFPLR